MTESALELTQASRREAIIFILKKAIISAFVALVLFSLMIGVRTEAGPTGQLIYWTRFGDLATIVAARLRRQHRHRTAAAVVGTAPIAGAIPPSAQKALGLAGKAIPPLLLALALLVPVVFYDQRYVSTRHPGAHLRHAWLGI